METVLSILMLAVLALPFVALAMWRKGDRKQAVLMVVLAVIVAGNLAIWLLPDAQGSSPVGRELGK